MSVSLQPLQKGHKYFVVVRAGTNAGLSKPTETVQVFTSIKNATWVTPPPNSDNYDGLPDDQRLGKIYGCINNTSFLTTNLTAMF